MHRLPPALHLFVSLSLSLLNCSALAADAHSENPIDFVRDVRPILKAHCYACHAGGHQEGGLRLDRRDQAMAGGDSGRPAIVPGNTAASRMIQAISGADAELRMPPEGEKPLIPADIEKLTRWISQGAKWPDAANAQESTPTHWAWQKPVKAPLPEVRNTKWPRHPIDYFVLAPLEAAGYDPSPEADRHLLARRVYLDLVGLPPTWQEVQAFVNDTSPDAFDKLVDRTLAHQGYGERWARVWLDLARYADSKGYGSDPLRTIWRYRDWVIDALNRNLPFDRFTIEQLAGDLLPDATPETILATAFHRNTMANDEGGTDDEEFRVAAVKDRAETTLQVWMGLTMGCAKCHTHKFDPITQREYYQVFAIFNQTEDADRGDEEPRLLTPSEEEQRRLVASRARLAMFDTYLAGMLGEIEVLPIAADVLRVERAAQDAEVKRLEKNLTKTPIMRELAADKRRETRMMIKGNFRTPGDPVQPAVLASFHPLPSGCRPDRLGLARWLVDRDNPLTARVLVNRVWARLFGVGLVATEEDFGTQGAAPSNQQLLDWLAVDLMEHGWDVKRLLREIVGSASYRQSSTGTPALAESDPGNRLLGRGARFRLEAEQVRDQALAIAGLLSPKQGGPSVYPPQPPGLWRAAFNGERTWATSTGNDQYRRGLYTYWRRTVPYPAMSVFDAPSREICTLRRISTNTPLQAFVTLNDPVFVEAAQALARRIIREGGATLQERAGFALRTALVRPPNEPQISRLVALYNDAHAQFEHDAEAANSMACDPLGPLPEGADACDLASWTVVANVVLNLDGVLTRR
jgi:hypothetical protein